MVHQKKFAEAERILQRACELGKDNPIFFLDLATCLRHLGRHDDARKAQRRVLELDNFDTERTHWLGLGERSEEIADFDFAEECYRKALAQNELLEQRRLAERTAQGVVPSAEDLKHEAQQRSELHRRLGKFLRDFRTPTPAVLDEAQMHLEIAVRDDAETALPYISYAVFLYRKRLDLDGAIERFRKALVLDPKDSHQAQKEMDIALARKALWESLPVGVFGGVQCGRR